MRMRIASLSLLTICCLILAVAPAMAQNRDLYDNGPFNGTTDAWTINFGFTVSDSYILDPNHSVNGFHFVYWDASSTDILTSVDWCTSGAPLCTPNATWGAGGAGTVSNVFLGTNQYGYSLFQADITGLNDLHFADPGFITLGNACSTSGCSVSNPIYWDENSGVGCGGLDGGGTNCPSTAYNDSVGSISSEAFTITGTTGAGTTPEPSSIMLLGSGILGVAGVLRHKLNI